jgi:hypothetical protein
VVWVGLGVLIVVGIGLELCDTGGFRRRLALAGIGLVAIFFVVLLIDVIGPMLK